ncbi:MAG: galactokinase [Lachnospiraceae bacterium]|nr:galactokinase [Lachnospiraceae bacterium]
MNIQNLQEKFYEVFGPGEDVREYFAPGRVNLIGEHTDYNGGHVFPCALTIGTYGVARKREDDKIHFLSLNIDDSRVMEADINNLEYDDSKGWANYPIGVVWAFGQKGMKLNQGFDMVIWGNIPNGSGLSSSASLEVLTAVVLRDLYSFDNLSMTDLALIGQHSENQYNGCNCGIMDQFAVANGKKDNAIFLDTSDLSFEYANIKLEDAKIVITNSKVKHSLVDGKYNERRKECAKALKQLQTVVDIESLGDLTEEDFEKYKDVITDAEVQKRAKHAVYENQRTIKAVKALANDDVETFGRLMNESHISLRDDYKVSCDEVDLLVELAWSIDGVMGSRITGGGFGGCTVSIVKNDAVDNFVKKIEDEYKKKTGIDAEFYIVDIGDGARKL